MARPETSIVITGASSGIGEALAEVYSEPKVILWLSGRDQGRLNKVAARCRALGATVQTEIIDVTNQKAMANWIKHINNVSGLDLVIANAGISGEGRKSKVDRNKDTREIFAVNISGVLNTILPAVTIMLTQGHGQLALMSSMAGFRGLPTAPAYAATKAAVLSYGDGLRGELRGIGIKVSVICPGFVRSRITSKNEFPMPFFMEANKAAQIIRKGLSRNKARIVFPWRLRSIMWLISALPARWTDIVLTRLRKKRAHFN